MNKLCRYYMWLCFVWLILCQAVEVLMLWDPLRERTALFGSPFLLSMLRFMDVLTATGAMYMLVAGIVLLVIALSVRRRVPPVQIAARLVRLCAGLLFIGMFLVSDQVILVRLGYEYHGPPTLNELWPVPSLFAADLALLVPLLVAELSLFKDLRPASIAHAAVESE